MRTTANNFQWTWFMSVYHDGRWVLTEGVASVDITRVRVSAVLYFLPDAPEYMRTTWKGGADGLGEVIGHADGHEAPTLALKGHVARHFGDGGVLLALVASDGRTTVGLARR
jgi:hypothetical protein